MLNLDTHIFLHALNGSLRKKEIELLSADEWGISSIVIWEIINCEISRLDFKGDPADEIIAATSNVYRVALVTRDKVMLKSKKTLLA